MTALLRVLSVVGIVSAIAGTAQAQPGGLPERLRALEITVATQASQIATLQALVSGLQSSYITAIDCDAGDTIMDVLNDVRARSAQTVYMTVSGTCHEDIWIGRDHVSIVGQPGAAIEGVLGPAVFVTAQDVRLDQLRIRGAISSLWIRHGHVEGSALVLQGGVTALMGSTVRLYEPTVIEAADQGITVLEESSFTIFGCDIHDARYEGVSIRSSTFHASGCTIARSGTTGITADEGANVTLENVSVTDSVQAGIAAGLGSTLVMTSYQPSPGRIAGSPIGLKVWGGSSVRLGNVTLETNGDGLIVGDSSVVERAGQLRITDNTGAGVRCDPAPAVPQLVRIDAASVFGNTGGDIVCAGY